MTVSIEETVSLGQGERSPSRQGQLLFSQYVNYNVPNLSFVSSSVVLIYMSDYKPVIIEL